MMGSVFKQQTLGFNHLTKGYNGLLCIVNILVGSTYEYNAVVSIKFNVSFNRTIKKR